MPLDLYKPLSSRLSWGLKRVTTPRVKGRAGTFEGETVMRVSSAFLERT